MRQAFVILPVVQMAMLTVMLTVVVVGGVVAGCRDGGGRSHAARGGGQLAGDFTLSEKPICLSTYRKQVIQVGLGPGRI